MSNWRSIDWRRFAADVDEKLNASLMSYRDIAAVHRIEISAMSRARNARVVSAANYVSICALFGLDPLSYVMVATDYYHVRSDDVSRVTKLATAGTG